MNTKTFAQQSRALLMEGVANKLLYWGFNANGSSNEEPNPVPGGYTFRGRVFDDATVPKLWKSLQQAIKNKGIEVVKEEAAYTWFNRMMALQIMSKNDYMEVLLAYVPGMSNTPQILQKARQGQYAFLSSNEQERLKRIITDFSKEQEAFALLLVGYCHSNKMLNNVFGRLDDYTELLLPDNMLQDTGFLHLLNTTDAITDEQYKEVELIGWLYQFYISERKDEVFASFKKKKKAEAKDIPAATQIFTPNWIVKYMVQNTVGKIWLDKNPNSKIKSSLKYLVENETDTTTEPIISEVSQLTLIDPAVGSGHIMVEGFDLLYQMYMEEYYTPEEAVESILKNNLFGLDLDERAAQLANFAILLKAAKQYRDVLAKGWLPNVYAMPESASFSGQEIKDFLGNDGIQFEKELTEALRIMAQAKNLGSIMKLSLSKNAWIFVEKRFEEVKNTTFRDINTEIIYQKIKSFIPVLLILSKKYTSVVANPPYMGNTSMNAQLKSYVDAIYPLTNSDLCTVFMEVLPALALKRAKYGFIIPPSWMFLTSFEKLREFIFNSFTIDSLLHLSRGIFGADFGSMACVITNEKNENAQGTYFRLIKRTFQEFYQEDLKNLFLQVQDNKSFKFDFDKYSKDNPNINFSALGSTIYYPNIKQSSFSRIPGSPFAYWLSENEVKTIEKFDKIGEFADVKTGLTTGKKAIYVRLWHEVNFKKIKIGGSDQNLFLENKWFPITSGGSYRKWYGNRYEIINWEANGRDVKREAGATIRNPSFYLKKGVSWSDVNSGDFSVRYFEEGFIISDTGPMAYHQNDEVLFSILAHCNTNIVNDLTKVLNPTIHFKPGNFASLPYVVAKNLDLQKIKESIDLSKNDWDSRETSWDFELAPLLNQSVSLKAAFQKWKRNVSKNYFELHNNEEEFNKIFIAIYGLQDELTPEVALKDISILQDELKKNDLEALEEKFRTEGKDAIELPINRAEVISQFISYAVGLFMGRYRLDKPGLNIAHPNPSKEELASYNYNHGKVNIDQDAILPIMGKNCNFNDDIVKQFTQLLDTIWGHEQRTENINFIQECLDKDLEKFIVNDFWMYHCGMYKKTPIYWLFSSKKGAFQVLVYMHRMNVFTVEKIRANYLLEHLKYLKSEIAQKEANASNLSTAEAKKLDKLRSDLRECEQYDLLLKNTADQQIKFDLDDGVAKNYELFESVVAKIK